MDRTKHFVSKLVCFGFCIFAGLCLGGCRGNPRAERQVAGEAVVNIGANPRTLDPSLAADVPSSKVILGLIRGLTVLDANSQPQPDLAESWEVSPDGLVYDIKLREAYWTNGEPVTADDFVYTWTRRVLNPEFASEYAYQLYNYLKGGKEYYDNPNLGPDSVWVWALAPDKLRIHLEAPTPFFPQILSHHSYFPVCRSVDEANKDWALRPETYVGCGPYKLLEYSPGDKIVMEKNPGYWDTDNVKLDRLVFRMIEEESTELIAFDTGELDATNTVPRPDIPKLRERAEYRSPYMVGTYFLFINCRREIFEDVRVRRALALAIDRRAIVESMTQAGEPLAFFISPMVLYSNPPEPTYQDADFDGARRLLAEAGYPDGQGLPKLRYIYNTMEGHRKIAEVLQETWRRELGIEMAVENQEFKVLLDNRRAGEFDIARAGWVADFADPINFLDMFESESDHNDSFWEDAHYDDLLAKVRAEADLEKREALMIEAELYFVEQMPAIPIYSYRNPYLVAQGLEGYENNLSGIFDPARLRWAEQ